MRMGSTRGACESDRHARAGAWGFTLLEALLAILVFALSTLTLITMLTHAMRGVRQNKEALYAKTAIDRVMEHERNMTFDALIPEGKSTFIVEGLPGVQGELWIQTTGLKKQLTVKVPVDTSRVWRLSTIVTQWTTNLANASNTQYPPG